MPFILTPINKIHQITMNKMKRLLTLLLLVCGITTGAWADLTPASDGWYELATLQDWKDLTHSVTGSL
jgi:hypothetical protein